jgi:hypothetical protein
VQRACLEALACSRADCRDFALGMTWATNARIFLQHIVDGTRAWRDNPRKAA